MFILCSQLCYDVCGTILASKVAHDAVAAYKDNSPFAPEVVAMLKDSFGEDTAVSGHQ